MRTPALALGWELWARHRWGLSIIGVGTLVAASLIQVLPADGARLIGELGPLAAIFVYLYALSIFVYAEGTLGGKAAGFPSRLFALPMRTRWLVAWPMLYGMIATALMWIGLMRLIMIPSGLANTV